MMFLFYDEVGREWPIMQMEVHHERVARRFTVDHFFVGLCAVEPSSADREAIAKTIDEAQERMK